MWGYLFLCSTLYLTHEKHVQYQVELSETYKNSLLHILLRPCFILHVCMCITRNSSIHVHYKNIGLNLTNWHEFFYAPVLLLKINCVITLSKTDVNLFFTITRPEIGQILGINKVLERQVWRVQVACLHKAACASPSFQILSVCQLIDDKNQPISAWEIGQLL